MDIREFYPSITKEIVGKSFNFAKSLTTISGDELRNIKHCRKSLLFLGDNPWKKKNTNDCFDVTMGSFDGAEVCELVGLYILNSLTAITGKNETGLYRDDGLIVQRSKNGHELDKIRKDIIKVFQDIGFQIDIDINLKMVNFLDVTFTLNENSFKPYKKPNDMLLYINTESNHPPEILKQIPISISNRLSQNSSSEEIFNASKGEYEESLKSSGYKDFCFEYKPPSAQQGRNRKRKIIWFNPPFNKDVETNIGKKFFRLLNKHFPKTNKLHKIFNKNTVKLSYSCTKNVSRLIKSHNKKVTTPILKKSLICNCRKNNDCPMDNTGQCRTKSVVYKCVASVTNKPDKVYIGLTEEEFKERHYGHKTSLTRKEASKTTNLDR